MRLSDCNKLVAGVLLTLGAALPMRGAVLVSNVDEDVFGDAPLGTSFWFANRFVTDGSAASFSLDSVTLRLDEAVDTSSPIYVALYANGLNMPGTQVALLSGATNPAAAGEYTYTADPGVVLSPNTSYWVVAGVTTGAGSYSWTVTESNSFSGTWTIPSTATHTHSLDMGETWDPATDGFARQFSISATPAAVPEPGMTAMLAGAAALGWVVVARRKRTLRVG